MKIFSVSQIKAWDSYSIQHEPVSSVDLMERAAVACSKWMLQNFDNSVSFKIFCGKGNNGGDGLAIARLLIENNYRVSVYVMQSNSGGSPEFEINLKRLNKISNEIYFLENESSFPALKNEIVIDALFGTGLNKKPSELFSKLISFINKFSEKVISVDVPSGLFVDKDSKQNSIIKANFTLSFQNQKLAFLMPENGSFVGNVVLLDIQLSKEYEEKENTQFDFVDKNLIRRIYIPRSPFSNKGNYGYACLLAGSYGMMGAAVLSSRACLRSGIGKLTSYICKSGYEIFQSSVPEAMCKTFGNTFIKDVKDFKSFDVVGIGPGIGRHPSHKQLLQNLFKDFEKPVVIDADALNVMSGYPALNKLIPPNSIITPHPKEFERLFGKSDSDFDLINLAVSKAKQLKIFIVLKGHFTLIASPDGKGYFNSTGNAGMATAGAGDVLTGIITGLLAQKYSSLNACILGVYLHGLAGDIAAKKLSEEALIAGDIINNLGKAFREIYQN
ncbi:MAG: NAD(P)H-hydrate dehydratase [Bacteroidota bacterium]|nr:NAD(P)H-hydrate dehydratase [Bacteroidota bacterium]